MSTIQNKLFHSLIQYDERQDDILPEYHSDIKTEHVVLASSIHFRNDFSTCQEELWRERPLMESSDKPTKDEEPNTAVGDAKVNHGDNEHGEPPKENMSIPSISSTTEKNIEQETDYRQIGLNRVENLFSKDNFCSLQNTFEEILNELRVRLNERYKGIRDEMQNATKAIVFEEMQRVLSTTQQLRDQVLSLRELAKNQERMIARKDHVIDDLMADLNRANQIAAQKIESYKAKTEAFTTELTDRLFKARLMRRIFTAWKSVLQCTWRSRYMQQLEKEARIECQRLTDEYHRNKRQLENELEMVKAEFQAARATQAEENATLKMALMRGVCALNMETLTLFNKDTHAHSGDSAASARITGSIPIGEHCNGMGNCTAEEIQQNYLAALPQLTGLRKKSECLPNGSLTSTGSLEAYGEQAQPSHLPTEAWPRQNPVKFEAKLNVNAVKGQGDSPNHTPANYLSNWVGMSRQAQLQCADNPKQNTLYREPNVRANLSPSQCSESESLCIMELPVTCALTMNATPSKSRMNSNTEAFKLFTNATPTCKSIETARRDLNSRTNSASFPSSCANLLPKAVLSQRPHTVQLGAPSGPSSNSSAVMASVQVHRHHPVERVSLSARLFQARKSTSLYDTTNMTCQPLATSFYHQ